MVPERAAAGPRSGPPPLRPFGLVLHRDGRWSHEGEPIRNRRLRALFDRSVRYLPEERAYVVQVGRFRGQIEIEETGFFVRALDAASGEIALSDRSRERLDPATLTVSPADGALLCRVKRALAPPHGLPARFTQAAQAELLHAVEETPEGPALRLAGRLAPLPGI
ncbi:MAG: hypothetical protein JSU66_10875 [Deltaproteobacteria bacterium]|nr:MAG: hypothetical protein JSU66_10875 [Deltaproteobacteria bacterium]